VVVWWAGACGAIAGLRFRLGSALDLAEACRLCARPENSERQRCGVFRRRGFRFSLGFWCRLPITLAAEPPTILLGASGNLWETDLVSGASPVDFHRSQLPFDLHPQCLEVVKENLRLALIHSSSWCN
jgi:hypothetical protein